MGQNGQEDQRNDVKKMFADWRMRYMDADIPFDKAIYADGLATFTAVIKGARISEYAAGCSKVDLKKSFVDCGTTAKPQKGKHLVASLGE